MSYFYLAGRMTGLPQFNFPEFERVSAKLRALGYEIVTPHELEESLLFAEAIASRHGRETHLNSQSEIGLSLLRRDAIIVMDPDCVGVIALPGWERSYGASQIEVYLASRFKKQIWQYQEDNGDVSLVWIDYDQAMEAHHALHRHAA